MGHQHLQFMYAPDMVVATAKPRLHATDSLHYARSPDVISLHHAKDYCTVMGNTTE
jgi:hypothetical protein